MEMQLLAFGYWLLAEPTKPWFLTKSEILPDSQMIKTILRFIV